MLERKIDRAIEKEAIKTGKMGTELVTVEMALTSGEIEGNTLRISYTEEI